MIIGRTHPLSPYTPICLHCGLLLCALNPGYKKHLRWSAERMRLRPTARVLDLCCGSGLSTEALLATYPAARVTGVDASAGMLEVARAKPALARARRRSQRRTSEGET